MPAQIAIANTIAFVEKHGQVLLFWWVLAEAMRDSYTLEGMARCLSSGAAFYPAAYYGIVTAAGGLLCIIAPMPWLFGAVVLFADQVTKWIAQGYAASRVVACGALVRFRFVAHRERAYEQAWSRIALAGLWVIALVSTIFLCRFTGWFHSGASRAGLGLAFGGAAGNLADILARHSVIDFIDLGWWPVFNLADAAIVVGLGTAFLL
jgi:signal peptidase II